jgi:hypothetical protein
MDGGGRIAVLAVCITNQSFRPFYQMGSIRCP